jgi:hypothetical protein
MKITELARFASVGVLALTVHTAKANFNINPNTYQTADTTQGLIWFDVVGTLTGFDAQANPLGVNNLGGGGLGNNTVNVQFLFSQNGNQASSAVYTLDSGGNFGSISVASPSVSVVSPSVGPGAATYQVTAWVGGSAYGVGNTKNGISSVTSVTLGGPDSGGGPDFVAANLSRFGSFAVTAVPEPATIALGLFGAAGLFIRRRK